MSQVKVVENKVKQVLAVPSVNRAFHTFWQTFSAMFVFGATGLASALLHTHNFSDAKTGLVALIVAAGAAGLAAVRPQLQTVGLSVFQAVFNRG